MCVFPTSTNLTDYLIENLRKNCFKMASNNARSVESESEENRFDLEPQFTLKNEKCYSEQ